MALPQAGAGLIAPTLPLDLVDRHDTAEDNKQTAYSFATQAQAEAFLCFWERFPTSTGMAVASVAGAVVVFYGASPADSQLFQRIAQAWAFGFLACAVTIKGKIAKASGTLGLSGKG